MLKWFDEKYIYIINNLYQCVGFGILKRSPNAYPIPVVAVPDIIANNPDFHQDCTPKKLFIIPKVRRTISPKTQAEIKT